MCVELLHEAKRLTVEQAIEIANSPGVYGADSLARPGCARPGAMPAPT